MSKALAIAAVWAAPFGAIWVTGDSSIAPGFFLSLVATIVILVGWGK